MTAKQPKKKSEFAKLPAGDKVMLTVGYVLLGLFVVAIILPMVYIILASFIDPITLQNSGLTFDFSKWTTTAYERVLENAQIWVGFKNALIYSILFTILSVVITLLAAYPMSRADFKGKGFFNTIFVITMFFGGGLIPTYLLISNLGMLNTIWAILLPGAFSVWNMIIARTYYMGVPRDLQEAAEIDGASEMVYFFKDNPRLNLLDTELADSVVSMDNGISYRNSRELPLICISAVSTIDYQIVTLAAFYPLVLMLFHCISSAYIFHSCFPVMVGYSWVDYICSPPTLYGVCQPFAI